jgi:hypothetical protein
MGPCRTNNGRHNQPEYDRTARHAERLTGDIFMKLAHYQDLAVQQRLANRGIPASLDEARTLRKAEKTLSRWSEMECGDGNEYASWCIERDETTGKPYLCTYPHQGRNYRRAIPDREAGALKRVAALCKELGLSFYHQGDPRGCALYVDAAPLTDTNYSNGVAVSD